MNRSGYLDLISSSGSHIALTVVWSVQRAFIIGNICCEAASLGCPKSRSDGPHKLSLLDVVGVPAWSRELCCDFPQAHGLSL